MSWFIPQAFAQSGQTQTPPPGNTGCVVGDPSSPTNLLNCFPLSDGSQALTTYTTPAMLVNLFVNLMFVGAGLLIFVWILYAGFKMISGKKKGFDEAKTMMTNAITGLVIMIIAYWLVQLVGWVTGLNLAIGMPAR